MDKEIRALHADVDGDRSPKELVKTVCVLVKNEARLCSQRDQTKRHCFPRHGHDGEAFFDAASGGVKTERFQNLIGCITMSVAVEVHREVGVNGKQAQQQDNETAHLFFFGATQKENFQSYKTTLDMIREDKSFFFIMVLEVCD
jgi:hypothetical protein